MFMICAYKYYTYILYILVLIYCVMLYTIQLWTIVKGQTLILGEPLKYP